MSKMEGASDLGGQSRSRERQSVRPSLQHSHSLRVRRWFSLSYKAADAIHILAYLDTLGRSVQHAFCYDLDVRSQPVGQCIWEAKLSRAFLTIKQRRPTLRRNIHDEPSLGQYSSSPSSSSPKPALSTVFRVLLMVGLVCLACRISLNPVPGLVCFCGRQV